MKVLLNQLEISNIWAKNGFEAIQQCLSNPEIDLVLMDIKMKDMSGLEATGKIKKTRPLLPVIAQTAHAIYGDREIAIKAGCDDYITKPIQITVLYDIINKYLS